MMAFMYCVVTSVRMNSPRKGEQTSETTELWLGDMFSRFCVITWLTDLSVLSPS